ncbi:hypothetical protein Taro_023673 [Colocasia esculenta]|uniref:Uncharacterized protein n=1 Tax=Colocasia esculenta TaxID=4460 RepID=A0A843VI15_COLES|nr:hypothetical protein [Colocasia esculenta]
MAGMSQDSRPQTRIPKVKNAAGGSLKKLSPKLWNPCAVSSHSSSLGTGVPFVLVFESLLDVNETPTSVGGERSSTRPL